MGIVGADTGSASVLVRKLVGHLCSQGTWANSILDTPLASIAWAGWRVPVVASVGGVTAVVDGLFYNRDELDDKLGMEAGSNDAHRLISNYKKFGFETAVRGINGDFAVALFDNLSNTLWLARDRFGVKPLYYASSGVHFGFASRPRPLRSMPGLSPAINRRFAAVFAGAHYRYIDNASSESPYEAISQLPAAHWLSFSGGHVAIGRYWDLVDSPELDASEQELGERYRTLLLDSVRRRIVASDGPPAFSLSGGLDSSSVLSCAVEFTGAPQHAFSSVYTDKTYDETDEIQSMLVSKVAKWHSVHVGMPDVFSIVSEMVAVHDEPVVTATWLSHYLLCKEVAASGFKTLYGGLGGDELNAGEYEYFFFHFADLRKAGDEKQLAYEIENWVRHHDHPIHRKSAAVVENAFGRMTDMAISGRCLPDADRMRRYYATIDPEFYDLRKFEPVLDHPFQSYLKNRTYQDLFRETAPCCLRAEDRQSTHFGLDRIDPFFDHHLAEFMFSVPGKMKIRDGITKRLLREAMKGVLPEETRTRIKKTGWNAPAHAWFSDGASFEALGDLLGSRAFRERGLYRIDEVQRLFTEHTRLVKSEAAKENHMMFFWQLVNVDTWLQQVEGLNASN